jgi:ribonuclease P protein component
MKRKFRLRKSTDFKRVRRLGKSYAHPFVVLIKHPNHEKQSRFGVVAGRSAGNAVQRNRVKRRIREIIRSRIPSIMDGWDIILLARCTTNNVTYAELQSALDELLKRAEISKDQHVQ